MEKNEQFIRMNDGHEVFITTFTPQEQTTKHLHILHGMAEHSKRYTEFAEMLCQQGYFVSMHDHRGHGCTAQRNGKLGFFAQQQGFNRVVRDVFEVLHHLQRAHDLPKPVLFGHSMGSFIARRYMQLHSESLEKVILCATGATTLLHLAGNRLAKQLVKIQGPEIESKLMNELSFGSFNKSFKNCTTPFDWLCSDKAEVQKYINDSKCGFIATNQFFADLTDGLLLINKPGENSRVRPELPVLFISGSNDPVGDMGKGVLKVAKQLQESGVEQVKVYLFEGMRHEVLNEPNKQHAYDIIIRWLENE